MMKILNGLPVLKSCLECWEKPPTHKEFIERYADPMIPYAKKFFHGWGAPFSDHLEWNRYRTEALHVDPHQEEARVAHWVRAVERLFGFELEGEIILCGAFEEMDGFARFDRGTHRVFLGVDESHRQGPYLDILETHELTHVARESRPEVWQGWGLDPKMERAVYVEAMPDIEHLISEGLACAVSEILVPGQDPWKYCYQTEETYRYVMTHAQAVDREIQNELNHPRGDWSRWYNGTRYRPEMPDYAHYVWAWHWVRTLLRNVAENDSRKLISRCSKEFIPHALSFELSSVT